MINSNCAVNRPAVCCVITQAGFMIIRGLVQMQRLRFNNRETGDLLKRFLRPPTSESHLRHTKRQQYRR